MKIPGVSAAVGQAGPGQTQLSALVQHYAALLAPDLDKLSLEQLIGSPKDKPLTPAAASAPAAAGSTSQCSSSTAAQQKKTQGQDGSPTADAAPSGPLGLPLASAPAYEPFEPDWPEDFSSSDAGSAQQLCQSSLRGSAPATPTSAAAAVAAASAAVAELEAATSGAGTGAAATASGEGEPAELMPAPCLTPPAIYSRAPSPKAVAALYELMGACLVQPKDMVGGGGTWRAGQVGAAGAVWRCVCGAVCGAVCVGGALCGAVCVVLCVCGAVGGAVCGAVGGAAGAVQRVLWVVLSGAEGAVMCAWSRSDEDERAAQG
jgi:hypothetical protein